MKLRKILLEQSTWTDLPEDKQRQFKQMQDIAVKSYFRNQTPPKDARKKNGKWQTIDLSAVPTPTQTPTQQVPPSSFSKYVGKYDGEGILPEFNISEITGKLYIVTSIGNTEILNISGNQFAGSMNGVAYVLNFNETNGQITGGTAKVGPVSINFTKKTETTPSPTNGVPNPINDINWTEVARDTWEGLKSAGYWVKEQGGKLWALIGPGGKKITEEEANIFKCIDKWNEFYGYYPLLRGNDGDSEFAYETTTHKVDGRTTKIIYYPNKKVFLKFKDTDKIVPNGNGTWECAKGGVGYSITWENGKKMNFGTGDKPLSTSDLVSTSTSNGTTKTIPSFSESCRAVIDCPKATDVINKGKPYKICMKCPEIKVLQEIPTLNIIYKKYLKENGKQEITDEVFGPIMKAAVEEYQEMNGRPKTGQIDSATYQDLTRDYYVKKKESETPKQNQTTPEQITPKTNIYRVAGADTKF